MAYYDGSLVDHYYVPSIASLAAPTVGEIGAGQKLSCPMGQAPDLSLTGTTSDAPDFCSTVTKKVVGPSTLGDSTMEFWADDDSGGSASATIKGLLAHGTSGFLVIVEPVNGAKQTIAQGIDVQVWPITITSNGYTQPAIGSPRAFSVGVTPTGGPTDATVA